MKEIPHTAAANTELSAQVVIGGTPEDPVILPPGVILRRYPDDPAVLRMKIQAELDWQDRCYDSLGLNPCPRFRNWL